MGGRARVARRRAGVADERVTGRHGVGQRVGVVVGFVAAAVAALLAQADRGFPVGAALV